MTKIGESMNAKDLGETLKTLVASGKDLREAGYTRIEIGDIKLELTEPEPPAPVKVPSASTTEEEVPAIDDPDTYGGHLPQRRTFSPRPEREE